MARGVLAAKARNRLMEGTGVGLGDADRVGADDGAEVFRADRVLREGCTDSPSSLLVHTPMAMFSAFSRSSRATSSGEGQAAARDVGRIEVDEAPVIGLDVIVLWQAARCGEAAGEQRAGAVAHEDPHLVHRDGPPADRFKHMIGGAHQVGRGVDEGSVEVENHGAIWHANSANLVCWFRREPRAKRPPNRQRRSRTWISARPRRCATY